MEKLGLNLGFLLVQIISFLILWAVLHAWVYKPLQAALKNRRAAIDKGLEDARVAAEARENAEKDAAAILSEAQSNAAIIIREAKEKAEAAGREVKAEVEADIAKARSDALIDVDQERARVLGEIRTNVASLAIAAAQKLVGEALDDKRQHAVRRCLFNCIVASGRGESEPCAVDELPVFFRELSVTVLFHNCRCICIYLSVLHTLHQ